MPSPKRKKSSTLSSSKNSSKLSTKRPKPQKKTTGKAKKKNRPKPVTFPYRDYPLVRYPKDFTQDDMEAFMEEFSKEGGNPCRPSEVTATWSGTVIEVLTDQTVLPEPSYAFPSSEGISAFLRSSPFSGGDESIFEIQANGSLG